MNAEHYDLHSSEFNHRRDEGPPSHAIAFRFGKGETLYNVFDAGNYLWGLSMYSSGFSERMTWWGSNLNEIFRGGDDAADQRAIFNGYRRYGIR